MYMIQSELYIFSPDFLQSIKKLDFDETQLLWNSVFFPKNATIDAVMKIIFDQRSYGRKVLLTNYLNEFVIY